MRNHFARVGLAPEANEPLPSSVAAPDGSVLDATLANDIEAAREILESEERDRHYRRVHLQYRAMADALDALNAPDALDSCRWRERLVEFVAHDDEPL